MKNVVKLKAYKKAVPENVPLNLDPLGDGTQFLYWRDTVWYLSIRIKGQPLHRISMKTADVEEAKRRAFAEFVKVNSRLITGKPLREMTLGDVARKMAAELKAEKIARLKYGPFDPSGDELRHPQTLEKKVVHIENFIIPVLGDKEIHQIDDADIKALKHYYATYWTEGPGKDIKAYNVIRSGRRESIRRRPLGQSTRNTVNNFAMTLNQVLKKAKVEYKSETKITKTVYVQGDRQARSSFTLEQYDFLIASQEKRIAAEKRSYHAQRMRRLIWLCEFARWSGLRPAELKKLKWGQIVVIPIPGGRTLQMNKVFSKGLPPRTVSCLHQIMKTYDAMLAFLGRVPDPNEYVFCSYKSPFRQCKLEDGFQVMVQKAGLWLYDNGKYRSLGSIRHTYAQYMIHNMQPFNLYKLCINMGTSEKQIRDHYAADIDMREDIQALAGEIEGLVSVFFDGAAPVSNDPLAKFFDDAKEVIKVVGDEIDGMDDEHIIRDITDMYGADFNRFEREAILAAIRKLRQ